MIMVTTAAAMVVVSREVVHKATRDEGGSNRVTVNFNSILSFLLGVVNRSKKDF